MSGIRTLVLVIVVAAVGALGTLAVGAIMGMDGHELSRLALALVPAAIVTIVAALLASRLLARASLRQRFVAVAVIAAAVAMANVAVLSMQMFVSDHDATLVTVLLVYAVGTGLAAALAVSRVSSRALAGVRATADRLADGDLDARAGTLDAGPEIDALGRALDQMAARLQLALANERAAERTRRDLITTVSHDLRTPLASLRAMVEALDDGVVTDPIEVRRYASEMRRSTEQLVTLVDDLFELSQLDAGAIAAETRRARLVDVVASAVDAVGAEATRKHLSLATDLGGADETPCSPRLTRVLQNLLSNAVRHTPADGRVRVTAARANGRLALAVEDTGEGIKPEDLSRVFEPFFRADPARSGPGAGLGLALAKRIVDALGGDIRAESRPEAGSRFAVELPVPGAAALRPS
jgi:signal transduction histidine kinase